MGSFRTFGLRYTLLWCQIVTRKHKLIWISSKFMKEFKLKSWVLQPCGKRLGTGLRKLVKKYVDSDEKMGGKGQVNLTEPVIKKLTHYYRNDIIKNLDHVKKMKNSIFATLLHCQSTEKTYNMKSALLENFLGIFIKEPRQRKLIRIPYHCTENSFVWRKCK